MEDHAEVLVQLVRQFKALERENVKLKHKLERQGADAFMGFAELRGRIEALEEVITPPPGPKLVGGD
jgi:hypothetical protein